MSYTIKKTDGTTLATVPENEIVLDATSLALIGRGATNYGVGHSENFVHLLENFAHTTSPAHPLQGQIWYDKTVGSLKVYNGTSWSQIGGGAGGTGTDGAGMVYVNLGSTNKSALALVAGGKVIAAICSVDVPAVLDLPETIQFLDAALPFRASFPNGLQAGQTLATDGADFVYQGHVPQADAALYTGGGTPFGGTSFVDLGDSTVTLHISGDTAGGSQIMGVFSSVLVPNSALPATVSVAGNALPFKARFPAGLVKGLTFAGGTSIAVDGGGVGGDGSGSSITIGVVEAIADQSIAEAYTTWFAEADAKYATASVTTAISAAFTSATGQTSLADAIDWLLVSAGEGTGSAEAGAFIQDKFKVGLGASSFDQAISFLAGAVTGANASALGLEELTAEFKQGLNISSVSQISDAVAAVSNAAGTAAAKSTALESKFLEVTGQTTIANAIQTLWTQASAGGNAIAGYSLNVDANGTIAGMILNANSATQISDFTIFADKFKFYHPSGGAAISPFFIEGGTVYIRDLMIGNQSIGYEKIKPLTILPQVVIEYAWGMPRTERDIYIPLYSGALSVSTGVIPAGSKIIVLFNGNIVGGDNDGCNVRIMRSGADSTTPWLPSTARFGVPDQGGSAQAWMWSDTVPVTGDYAYTAWGWKYTDDDGGQPDPGGSCTFRQANMIIFVQKQAA